MFLKYLPMAVSVLDTGGRTPYGARAFGTVVTATEVFKGVIVDD